MYCSYRIFYCFVLYCSVGLLISSDCIFLIFCNLSSSGSGEVLVLSLVVLGTDGGPWSCLWLGSKVRGSSGKKGTGLLS